MIHCLDIREAGAGLQEIGPSITIIAVSHPSWDDGLNHNDVVDEVECHCQVTGVPYFQIDVASTTRWQQQASPIYPIVGIMMRTSQNPLKDGLAIAILIWHPDPLMMY